MATSNNTGVKTVFHVAVESNQLSVVKVLIEKGFDVNSRDHDGCTPLFYAIAMRHDVNCKLQMMEYLIENGADVNATSKTGASVLHIAARSGEPELVHFLVDKGGYVNARDNEGKTPLEYAVELAEDED